MGVNPADGALFVATHYGMFRIAGNQPAQRVGTSYQDTMGFTIVGPNEFLGSGHPDTAGMRQGLPPLLGLIGSTDAGMSWEPVSLLGKVDFHGLVSAHGTIYGRDSTSGGFMVSDDRRRWETRSTVALNSFVVDPADRNHLLATTSDGLVESTDGARTWRRPSGAQTGPTLLTLSWDAVFGLWGVDPEGVVMRRRGDAWTRTGALPGPSQALLATNDALYAAAAVDEGPTGIYRSSDGAKWTLLYRDPPH